MTRQVERTADGWFDAAVAAARARVQLAKSGLGERGTAGWEQDAVQRRDRWESALRALED